MSAYEHVWRGREKLILNWQDRRVSLKYESGGESGFSDFNPFQSGNEETPDGKAKRRKVGKDLYQSRGAMLMLVPMTVLHRPAKSSSKLCADPSIGEEEHAGRHSIFSHPGWRLG